MEHNQAFLGLVMKYKKILPVTALLSTNDDMAVDLLKNKNKILLPFPKLKEIENSVDREEREESLIEKKAVDFVEVTIGCFNL
jgi:hypothetical protein